MANSLSKSLKHTFFRKAYTSTIRPICFIFDPELIHNLFLTIGKLIQKVPSILKVLNNMYGYQDSSLNQNLLGINFRNPVGLAAGFDKNIELIPVMNHLGFGFTEGGSITALPCEGNPGKRIARLIDKKSIWVNLGLNNKGADNILPRLKQEESQIPVFLSIAKTNCTATADTQKGIEDYISTLRKAETANVVKFYVINVSCPNAYGGQPFHSPDLFQKLMKEIRKLNLSKPILVKLSPDLSEKYLDKIIIFAKKYKVSGFICSNLTKETGKHGGYSGKIQESKSNKQLSYVYHKTKGKMVLVGTGGIFSAEDAYRKIKLGANLVQLITGMIYEGPGIVGEINHDLVQLLKADGYKNIKEAIGTS